MSTEPIIVEVTDKVASSIAPNIKRIGDEARKANTAVQDLQKALNSFNGSALAQMVSASNTASRSMQQAALAAQRLATEQMRTVASAANAAAAQIRVSTAMTQGAIATQNLAVATQRLVTSQTEARVSTQRLATEVQRTAAATQDAAAAASRAALAALELKRAQDQGAKASTAAAGGMSLWVKAAAAAATVGLSAKAILDMSDAYTTLQNKLQNVSKTQEQTNELTAELFDLANRSRAPIDATATAFTRFDRALLAMGKSQKDTLVLTETVNKALVVGGATATEASSALLQLSQAFNAGKLQGDEFKSLAENMPMVLDAVAKVLGKPTSALKKLGSEGKITSEVLYKAFELMRANVFATFEKTVPTIGQAFVVLKNSATQFFGELDKSLGITRTFAGGIIFLAKNLKDFGIAAAAVGAGLAVYFGPALVAILANATRAVTAFTVSLLTNPLVLLATAVAVATYALIKFGDQIKITSDGAVSLKDAFRTAYSYIGDATTSVGNTIKSLWNTAIDEINKRTDGMGEKFRNIGDVIASYAKTATNTIVGYFVGAFNGTVILWKTLPASMEAIFSKVVNFAATAVEAVVNSWQLGFRKIAEMAAVASPDFAKSLTEILDKTTIELPRMEVSESAKVAASDIGKAFSDAFNQDYVGDASTAFMERARKEAAARKKMLEDELKRSQGNLRGTGPNTLGSEVDEKASRRAALAAENRAAALLKVNTQLENEGSRLFFLKPEREAQAKFDQIEETMIGKKIKLTDSEKDSIMEKIKAIQSATIVQAQYDRIYEEVTGPATDYNFTLTAANKLLNSGAISHKQYVQQLVKASNAFDAANDPMLAFNKDLNEQFQLLKLIGPEREIEQAMMQMRNELLTKGIILSQDEEDAYRNKLTLLQQVNAVATEEKRLYDSTAGARKQFVDQMSAIKNLLAGKDGKSITKNDALLDLGQSGVGEFLNGLPEMLGAQVKAYDKYYEQIDALREADLISEESASAAKVAIYSKQLNMQLSAAQDFFSDLGGLSESSSKTLSGIGKAANKTSKVISGVQKGISLVNNGMKAYSTVSSLMGASLGSSATATAAGNIAGALGGDALGTMIAANGSWAGIGVAGAAEAAGTAAGAVAAEAMSGTMSALSGAMSGIAAAMPYIGAALMVYQLVSSEWVGEKRSGGTFTSDLSSSDTAGATFLHGPSGGTAGADTGVKSAINATTNTINAILSAVGSKEKLVGYQAAFEQSEKGRGGVMSGGTLSGGATFGESGQGSNYNGTYYEKSSTNSPTVQQALDNLVTDLKQSTIQALQAANDVPLSIKKLVNGVDSEALDDSAVTELLETINSQIEAVTQFRLAAELLPFENLRDLSYDAAAGLIEYAGGLQNLQSLQDSYFTNYYSESERMSASLESITATFTSMGYAVPTSTEAFRALVSSIDLTTDAGQKAYATLLGLQGAFKQWSDYAKTSTDKVTTNLDTIFDRLKTATDLYAEQARDNLSTASKAAQDAYTILSNAINKEKGKLQDAWNIRLEALNTAISASQDTISSLKSLSNTIESTLRTMAGSFDSKMNREQASRTIAAAYNTVSGGGIPDSEELNAALSVIAQSSDDAFASIADYQYDLLKNANDVAELGKITDKQLSTEEQSLSLLKKQLADETQRFNDEMKKFDDMLAVAADQLEIANGTKLSVMSIEQATLNMVQSLNALAQAQGAVKGLPNAGKNNPLAGLSPAEQEIYKAYTSSGDMSVPDADGMKFWAAAVLNGANITDIVAQIKQINNAKAGVGSTPANASQGVYDAYAGSGLQNLDLEGYAFWTAAIANGADPQAIYAEIAAINNAKAVNGSHANGLRNVPFDGYIAETHKGEAILPRGEAEAWRNMSERENNGPDYAEVIVKLSEIEVGIRMVQATTARGNENTKISADVLNQLSAGGTAPIAVEIANVDPIKTKETA